MGPELEAVQDIEPTPSARERKLTLIQHLDELRRRLWRCLAVIAAATVFCALNAATLIAWLKAPAGEALPRLAFFSPAESLTAYLKVAVTGGLLLSLPVLLAQAWAFIQPALTQRERAFGTRFVWWGSALFFVGAAFAYWVLLPTALHVLLTFGTPELEPVISVSRYLGFVTTILLVSGAAFELPLLMYLLAALGIVAPRQLRRHWRTAYLAIVVGAAVLTPTPDAVTMLLMTVPLWALYEISVLIAHAAAAGRRPHA